MASQEPSISWQVDTHQHIERAVDWYWALGLLAVGGAIIAVFLSNILLAVILLIGAGCIGFLALRGPRQHTVRVDGTGVHMDGTMYPYSSIHSFIVEDAPRRNLILTMSSLVMPRMVISLENTNTEAVREQLRRHLVEVVYKPHIMDSLAEIFGL